MNNLHATHIRTEVDRQLLSSGCFSALELLLSTGILKHSDYEAWRTGRYEVLDDYLSVDDGSTTELLEEAIAYARTLGLTPEDRQWMARNSGEQYATGSRLYFSRDPELAKLLAVRFERIQQSPQMDLFLNNPVTIATNDLIFAILQHRIQDATRLGQELKSGFPDHQDLAAFDLCIQVLTRTAQPAQGTREELSLIEDQILKIAPGLLGKGWKEFLDYLWQWLARARRPIPFDKSEPAMHASRMLAMAGDWPGAIESILEQSDWAENPDLSFRLASAYEHLNERIQVLRTWCHLCWLFTDQAESRLNDTEVWQPFISELWKQFILLENASHNPLDCRIFPAWMLIHEPGLARILEPIPPAGNVDKEPIFELCLDLVHAHLAGDQELDLRRNLQTLSPALLDYYLTRGSHHQTQFRVNPPWI